MSDTGPSTASLYNSLQAKVALIKGLAQGLVNGVNGRTTPAAVQESLMVVTEESERATIRMAQRNEIIVKLLSTVLGLAVSFGISYYGIRWLVNVMDPTRSEKQESQKRAEKLMKTIGVNNVKLTEYELCIASNLVDPLTMVVDWEDIGGLEATIREIRDSVIIPFKHRERFTKSGLIQPPKGVLLYGPPGCGKTMIAKATAKATGARFINLQVSSLVDKWYGESQKRAEAVFSLAHKLQPIIIFIDEIDSFLRARMSSDHEATSMIKTQFMSFWDGLITDPHCHIMIIGATNRPSDVDAAILRRMPCMFHIGLPDALQRRNILEIILRDETLDESLDLDQLARLTDGLSGSDLREVCRSAAISRVLMSVDLDEESTDDEQFKDSEPNSVHNLRKSDFDMAIEKFRTTKRVAVAASMQQITID